MARASDWQVVAEQVAFNFLGDYLDPNRLEGVRRPGRGLRGAIREGRAPVVTGHDGRAAVEMVEAADRSAASGQAVALPLGA